MREAVFAVRTGRAVKSVLAVLAVFAVSGGANAQAGAVDPRGTFVGPTLAAPDEKPAPWRYGDPAHSDLSGVWQPTALASERKERIPLTPAYVAKLEKGRRLVDAGSPPSDSVTGCIALGMPRYMSLAFELVQTPGQITMVSGTLTDVRRIYIDGQPHSADFEPSYNGDSIGHWDGDVLVVETDNLLAGTMDQYGVPYSDQLKIEERYRRTAPNRLEITFTLTDPLALTRPFTYTRSFNLQKIGTRLEEYRCVNNRNTDDNGLQSTGVGHKSGE